MFDSSYQIQKKKKTKKKMSEKKVDRKTKEKTRKKFDKKLEEQYLMLRFYIYISLRNKEKKKTNKMRGIKKSANCTVVLFSICLLLLFTAFFFGFLLLQSLF